MAVKLTKETPDFLAGFYDGLLNEENSKRNREYEVGWRKGRCYMLKRVNHSLMNLQAA